MTLQLRKAERKQTKLRIGMSGPSGSGKTFSALKLARGLTDSWNKIALIDTENKRGDMYSHLGEYNIITLESPFTPERFIEAIKVCEAAGSEVIIIDSSSHEWNGPGGCLEINENLAQTKFRGNSWAAWSVTTPRHQRFIEAIIASPCHVITTMRSKTETIQTDDKKIKKVGLKEIQREGFEYEMTISFNIDRDTHYAVIDKDNTELFRNNEPILIDETHGKKIREWNESGVVDITEQKKEIIREAKRIGLPTNDGIQLANDILDITNLQLKPENFEVIIQKLRETKPIDKQIKEQKEIAKEIKQEAKKDTSKIADLRKLATEKLGNDKDEMINMFLTTFGFNLKVKEMNEKQIEMAIGILTVYQPKKVEKNPPAPAGKEA